MKITQATEGLVPDLIPTSIDSVFILDLPMSKIEELTKLEDEENTDPFVSIVWMFEELIRDADGEKFEDIDRDSLKNLGLKKLQTIAAAATEAMNVEGKE